MSASAVERRTARGDWKIVLPAVYLVDGAEASWKTRVAATNLWAGSGSALSHHTAAALWDMDGFSPGRLTVTTTRSLRAVGEIEMHRVSSLPPAAVCVADGLNLTTPARTLLDLAAVASADAVEVALDGCLRVGLVSLPRLRWFVQTHGGSGKPGTRTMKKLLHARPPGYVPPHSALERQVWDLIVRSGLPVPVRQHVVRGGARLVARVDLAYPDALVAVEADGYRWHSGRREWSGDLRRRNKLTALGWLIFHVTHEDLRERPEEIVQQLRQLLGERLLCPSTFAERGSRDIELRPPGPDP